MRDIAIRYLNLLIKLLKDRTWSSDEEDDFLTETMADLWWKLTEEEQKYMNDYIKFGGKGE